jgi:hypothetical protein
MDHAGVSQEDEGERAFAAPATKVWSDCKTVYSVSNTTFRVGSCLHGVKGSGHGDQQQQQQHQQQQQQQTARGRKGTLPDVTPNDQERRKGRRGSCWLPQLRCLCLCRLGGRGIHPTTMVHERLTTGLACRTTISVSHRGRYTIVRHFYLRLHLLLHLRLQPCNILSFRAIFQIALVVDASRI